MDRSRVSIAEPGLDGAADVAGHVRIRAKTQGIALSLGDKITISQKALKA